MTQIEQTEGGSMLEQMARAAEDADTVFVASARSQDEALIMRASPEWGQAIALAILQALRDSTPEMIEAGEAEMRAIAQEIDGTAAAAMFDGEAREFAKRILDRMIDVAMEGGS